MRTCFFSTWFPAVCLTVFATSCGLFPGGTPHKAKPVLYDWSDGGGPGEVSVAIDLRNSDKIKSTFGSIFLTVGYGNKDHSFDSTGLDRNPW